MAPRTPGQRAGLTHEQVIAAARNLVDHGGIEGLTMRALAQRLGVAPNTLYSHVTDKTALVDDLLDDLLAEVDAPSPETADPGPGLYDMMDSTYTVLVAHPGLVPLYLARQGARGPNARRLGDIAIALLNRAGVQDRAADEALRVLIVHAIGFAAFAANVPNATSERPRSQQDLADNFRTGLRWLLVGILSPASDRASARSV